MSQFTTSVVSSKWITITGTVAGSGTEDIETTEFSDLLRAAYEIVLYNDTEVKYQSFSAHVARVGSGIKDTLSAGFRDGLDVDLDFILSGSDVILRVTNNETFSVEVSLETMKVRR